MKIFLIGYRCTGKTTVGKALAAKLGFGFIDTDEQIRFQAKSSISALVEARGWERFRQTEKQVLLQTIHLHNQVISTGGGIILDEENRRYLHDNGTCIWLNADPDIIVQRMKTDANTPGSRPALTDMDLEQETRTLLDLRNPLYEAIAHMKVDTGQHAPEQIIETLYRRLV